MPKQSRKRSRLSLRSDRPKHGVKRRARLVTGGGAHGRKRFDGFDGFRRLRAILADASRPPSRRTKKSEAPGTRAELAAACRHAHKFLDFAGTHGRVLRQAVQLFDKYAPDEPGITLEEVLARVEATDAAGQAVKAALARFDDDWNEAKARLGVTAARPCAPLARDHRKRSALDAALLVYALRAGLLGPVDRRGQSLRVPRGR